MDEAKDKLEKLLERRKNYFLLTGIQRKIYGVEFEKMQKEIIRLKIHLEIYEDELDLIEVNFNYQEDKAKIEICEKAQENKELRWLNKKYDPEKCLARYIAIVHKQLSDEWLKEEFEMQQMKRQGWMECPWPTRIGDE
jgi:hypothetical protein